MATVLAIDDDQQIQLLLRRLLTREGFDVVSATTAREGLRVLAEQPIDVLVLDVELPDQDGLSVLSAVRAGDAPPPVVMVSGRASLETAVKAVQLGASDFIQKPFAPERLLITVANVLRFERLRKAHADLESDGRHAAGLIGESPAMEQVRRLIRKAAPTDGRVLITGENGTGKELVARAIHDGSPRRERPMVKLNCAAVPHELIESELFGHEAGAFTGAIGARRGKLEEANGGTLLLDEVGEMPLAMQPKLLRVLQEGELERLGSNKPIRVDVRVIAATNRDLEAMVANGTFREDLYYRLDVIHIHVPPLRERGHDIITLTREFLERAVRKNGRPKMTLTQDAERAISELAFPGNVRELQNLVERLVILTEGTAIDGPDVAGAAGPKRKQPSKPEAQLYDATLDFRTLVDRAQRRILEEALQAHGGKMSETARSLGLERSHLYKKCKALGVSV